MTTLTVFIEAALVNEEFALKKIAEKLSAEAFGSPAYAAVLAQNYAPLLVSTARAAAYRNVLQTPDRVPHHIEVLTRQVIARTSVGGGGLLDAHESASLQASASVAAHLTRLLKEHGNA